jgi:hypothetical protein
VKTSLAACAFFLCASMAHAQGLYSFQQSKVHLVAAEDLVGSVNAPTPPPGNPDTPRLVAHLGVSIAAGFVSVPVGLVLANFFGSLSNSLIWAAVPALLMMGLVAPTLTALAGWIFGNMNFFGRDDKPFPFLVPWLANVAINVVALVIAGFAGVSVGMPAGLFVLALLDGGAMGGATVGLMRALQRAPLPAQTLRSFAPGVSDTTFVSLTQTSF